jgi:hypothetical protein
MKRCILRGVSVSLRPGGGKDFAPGDLVDPDAIAVPGNFEARRPALTWGEAIGHYLDTHFEDAED